VTYTCKTWTLSVRVLTNFLVFDKQILRKISGPIQCNEGWRVSSSKLQKLIKGEDIVKYIQAQRIKWWKILSRMEDIKLLKKITDWNIVGVRTKV
jgi:hypothetical protein